MSSFPTSSAAPCFKYQLDFNQGLTPWRGQRRATTLEEAVDQCMFRVRDVVDPADPVRGPLIQVLFLPDLDYISMLFLPPADILLSKAVMLILRVVLANVDGSLSTKSGRQLKPTARHTRAARSGLDINENLCSFVSKEVKTFDFVLLHDDCHRESKIRQIGSYACNILPL